MSINTPHKVTLTEGQIGVILCSLEYYLKNECDGNSIVEFDNIFEELEGTIDKHYDKVEKAKAKQPIGEW